MYQDQNLSSYLVRPNLTPRRDRSWAGFRTRAMVIHRANPGIVYKTLVALAIWTALFASVRYALTPKSLTTQSAFSESGGVASLAQSASFNKAAPAAMLSRAAPIQAMPAGASPQQPVSTPVAPGGTYANSYARGQCTWYVASRRAIPSGWGNARSWYYNATASGWKVGTAPAVGAIAWTSAGWYGHVAIVEKVSADGQSVTISEMNYIGPYIKSSRTLPASTFKYIY